MKRHALVGVFWFCCPILVAGCSEAPSQPAEPIKGMTPGEYRDKAEMGRQLPSKAPKASDKSPG
jgi:hypothetical protein